MKTPYQMPTRVCFGDGALALLPKNQLVAAARKVMFCTGGSSLRKNGYEKKILDLLKDKEVKQFSGIPAEPGVEHLQLLTKEIKFFMPECIVAVGGGSVLDTAKAASFCAAHDLNPPDIPGKFISGTWVAPVVAIPTTAGTGSEVTPFCVFWDKKEKRKQSLGLPGIFASDALVDPVLTYSMPPEVTAVTGMDAFTQACEAYWNRDANPVSDDYALSAIRRMLPALPKAVKNGKDEDARRDMLLGSLEAGLAFSNTRTAACHSISYPMTARFGVAHGQAVGITLPEVLILNATVMPDRAARFCDALDIGTMEEAKEKIQTMMRQSGLKTRLSELGMGEDKIPLIVKEGFTPERMGNNPYEFTPKSLAELLMRIL